jgi:hypothetical protein
MPIENRSAHGFTRNILYQMDDVERLCSLVLRGWTVHNNMHDWAEIHRRVQVDGLSKRAACREFDLHWSSLEKISITTSRRAIKRLVPAPNPSSDLSWM